MKSKLRAIRNKIIRMMIKDGGDIEVGQGVAFKQKPLIYRHKNARIIIGENTIINSSNHGYHLNMHSRCKLYADREHALIKIGDNCRIHGTCIHAYSNIIIGDNCLIAANTQIIDGNGHLLLMDSPFNRINSKDDGKPILIEDNVWIGANCIILGGTTIGAGSVIAAGSVVKGNVPKKSIYGGNPATLIKKY